MRTRTRLTTPPGQVPVDDPGRRRSELERYTRGLEVPTEPTVPSRAHRPLTIVAALILLTALGYLGFRLATVGQYEDPSLSDVPTQEPAVDAPPTEG